MRIPAKLTALEHAHLVPLSPILPSPILKSGMGRSLGNEGHSGILGMPAHVRPVVFAQHVPLLTDVAKLLRQRLSELGCESPAAELAALAPPFLPSAVDFKVTIGDFRAALCDDRWAGFACCLRRAQILGAPFVCVVKVASPSVVLVWGYLLLMGKGVPDMRSTVNIGACCSKWPNLDHLEGRKERPLVCSANRSRLCLYDRSRSLSSRSKTQTRLSGCFLIRLGATANVLSVRLGSVDLYLKRERLLQSRDATQLGLLKMNLAVDYLNSAVEVSGHEPIGNYGYEVKKDARGMLSVLSRTGDIDFTICHA